MESDETARSLFHVEGMLNKHTSAEPPLSDQLPSIEEVFDISPLYGTLDPGETQQVSVTYYGHKEVRAFVKAVCEVKNGPTYELVLRGEASVLAYEISDHLIDLGFVPFDEVSEACLTIRNLGKVGLEFSMINLHNDDPVIDPMGGPISEHPIIIPSQGYIEPESVMGIVIQYLPGLPRAFDKKMLIQVAHFAPETICVKGEASFADIMLDLPRFEDETYHMLLTEAKHIVSIKDKWKEVAGVHQQTNIFHSNEHNEELGVQIEVDRLAIQGFIKKHSAQIASFRNTEMTAAIEAQSPVRDLSAIDLRLTTTTAPLDRPSVSIMNDRQVVSILNREDDREATLRGTSKLTTNVNTSALSQKSKMSIMSNISKKGLK